MKFGELRPGDVMTMIGSRAVVIAIQRPHPLSPRFIMIVCYRFRDGKFSIDMLDPEYDIIPECTVHTDGMRSFREALGDLAG